VPTGKVKWYDRKKGFGFIIPDEGGPDVFVHKSEIRDGETNVLEEGQPVQYENKTSPKGPVAVAVSTVDP
jgi:CspA family cold shock protein